MRYWEQQMQQLTEAAMLLGCRLPLSFAWFLWVMIGDFNAIALFYIHLYAEFPNAMFLFKSPDINQDDSIGTGSLFIFYLYLHLHTSVLN